MLHTFISFIFFLHSLLPVENDSFIVGENYQFKIKYGILTVGEAIVEVDPKLYKIANKTCYKISVVGKTAGISAIWKVKNNYTSYIDTSLLVPHKFTYSARENSYRRDQVIQFDQNGNEVVKTEKEQSKTFKVPKSTQDVVSGYYYLRNIDYNKLGIGHTLSAPLFFDEDLYTMRVKYAGKGNVNTRWGKIKVLKLNPVLPNNKMFKGENAIRIWVSDDKNRVPVKIEVDFSFGTVDMDLKHYEGTKYPFEFARK